MTSALAIAAAPVPQAGVDLLRIVQINEEIKRVVGVSFKINIMALNAIFLAKRAGTAARGFGVLSNELRVFSQDLRRCMQTLTGLIHGCVNEVSLVLQDNRLARLLGETAKLAPQQATLAGVMARRSRQGEQHLEQLFRLRRELERALEEVFQMVELGGVLAKSAKIEAAYGQSFAPSLAQVSGEFDGVVEEIRGSLESLRRSPFFAGNRDR
ncbi:chemotaxis protein [Dechloromonas denitrificans]|uniref:chemotaxis protein n=1 Tax=Dechloromonas denitrificans TaxID=281362 RepID=UPI001CFC229F|nr:chemotaxis protein [Dechloromonas denitrificans]UCV06970.1 chemotaxis protein [Dechloromonas denitrificans]